MQQIKFNLKKILNEKKISIRQLERDSGLHYETLRRLYHDDSQQISKQTISKLCTTLRCDVSDLIVVCDDND